jgi:RNA recognition motif-containing protein
MKNIYIANLSFGTTEQTVRSLFEAYGTVDRVSIVTDRETGQPKGFGFVEMPNDAEAEKAIAAVNGRDVGAARWRSMKPVRETDRPAAVAGVAPAAGIVSIVRLQSPFPTVKYLPRATAETVPSFLRRKRREYDLTRSAAFSGHSCRKEPE